MISKTYICLLNLLLCKAKNTVNYRLSAEALIKVFRFLGAALIRLWGAYLTAALILKIVKNTLRDFLV